MLLTVLAAEGPNSVHIPADPNEVYWASAAFFLVVGLLYWKGWPAFSRVLNNRTAGIRADLEVAERQRQEAEAQLTAQQAEVGDVGTERQRLLAEAAETAERLKVDLVARARTEAEAMRARALSDIENQRNQALSDLRAEVARLTRGAAEAVIRENLDASSQDQLIDSYIERVRQLS